MTKGPEGSPLAGARVVVHSLDGGTECVLTSEDAGVFTATNLKTGALFNGALQQAGAEPPL